LLNYHSCLSSFLPFTLHNSIRTVISKIPDDKDNLAPKSMLPKYKSSVIKLGTISLVKGKVLTVNIGLRCFHML
jgi:hypothetical protein